MFLEIADILSQARMRQQPIVQFLRTAKKECCREQQKRRGGQYRKKNSNNTQSKRDYSQKDKNVFHIAQNWRKNTKTEPNSEKTEWRNSNFLRKNIFLSIFLYLAIEKQLTI